MAPFVAHIGQAKAFSTAIQARLAALDGIAYAGFWPDFPERRWFAPPLGELFDRVIRFGSDADFDRLAPRARAALEALPQAGRPGAVSSETLTLRFLPNDLPTDIKLRRLARVLPEGARLFLVIRPPARLLRALYTEYLQLGFPDGYAAFAKEALDCRAIGFFDDLLPGRLLARLDAALDLGALTLVPAEPGAAAAALSDLLGVALGDLPERNPSPPAAAVPGLRRFNAEHPAPVAFAAMVEKHRAFADDAAFPDAERFALARRRREGRAFAGAAASGGAEQDPLALPGPLAARLQAALDADRAEFEALARGRPGLAAALAPDIWRWA